MKHLKKLGIEDSLKHDNLDEGNFVSNKDLIVPYIVVSLD